MPAIASLEDVKAAQKKGLDIYATCLLETPNLIVDIPPIWV